VTRRASDLTTSPRAAEDSADLLGDKEHIRETLIQHVVKVVQNEFVGRRFEDLAILELGAGAGFFAKSYARLYPEARLERFVQTDANPQDAHVVALDVTELSSPEVSDKLGGRQLFDVVLSIDVLSCLAFGSGLEEDERDALAEFNEGLLHVLKPDGRFFDFMACVANSQFVLRYVPHYCDARPGRFIGVLRPGGSAAEEEPLLFVTFDASLLGHVEQPMETAHDGHAVDAAEGGRLPLLRVAGRDEPLSYDALCELLQLPELCKECHAKMHAKSRKSKKGKKGGGAISLSKCAALSRKVLELLFRDMNDGGCPTNWELMGYVAMDPDHFADTFEEPQQLVRATRVSSEPRDTGRGALARAWPCVSAAVWLAGCVAGQRCGAAGW
jgi:hypothetical protein